MTTGAFGAGLKAVIGAVSKDKNLDKAVIVDALEQAILHAARRDLGASVDLEASYNEESDEIELFKFRTVVEEVADQAQEITLAEAQTLEPDAEIMLGDTIGEEVDTSRFGRIAAQSAKQIIVQKVRDAERSLVYEEFKDRVGEILGGNIRRFERSDIIVDLGATEAIIPYREQIPGEKFRVKDRIQAYVSEIRRSSRGPQIVMSRAHPGFLVSLFEQNVSEIYDGVVNIESASRDAGMRSKIAVSSKDPSVDPVGACVGIKGARVQAVVGELNGEKIDIVPWDPDPARLVCNALAPAVVSKVVVDDDNHSMEVIVADDQLSLAIGKRGQNVRLAAQLTGWRLDITGEASVEKQMNAIKETFARIDGLGELHAGILVNDGIHSLSELVELTPRSLVRLLNLEDEQAEAVLASARRFLEELGDVDANVGVESEEFRAEDAVAAPSEAVVSQENLDNEELNGRVQLFLGIDGVGEAAASALAEAGYRAIGDVIADSPDEVAMKTGLPLGVARTVQIAADRFLQK